MVCSGIVLYLVKHYGSRSSSSKIINKPMKTTRKIMNIMIK